ncbi:hypothetical protein LUZ60_000859 [Juncus effusus]|nr:hypothetical protein LUZ60_000859 [Juncus effusus]
MASLWFLIFFICGLINTYLFFFVSPKKFFAWISSLLTPPTSKKTIQNPTKLEENGDNKRRELITPISNSNNLDLETLFLTFDHDGDGFITLNELQESFKRLGLSSKTEEALNIIHRVDKNKDGLIDLEEFRELYDLILRGESEEKNGGGTQEVVGGGEEKEREMKEAFDVFDKNKDGLISPDELKEILALLGLNKGARIEDCMEMIRSADNDGDGTINFDEFKKMMAFKGGMGLFEQRN